MRVYVRLNPRSLALVSETSVMILFPIKSNRGTCSISFLPRSEFPISQYQPLSKSEGYGLLGLSYIDGHIYLGIISGASKVALPRNGETVQRIDAVEFHCLTNSDWDYIGLYPNGFALDASTLDTRYESLGTRVAHPCTELKKLLSDGSFYYSTDFNITQTLQQRGIHSFNNNGNNDHEQIEETNWKDFMWNAFIMSDIIKYRNRLDPTLRAIFDASGFNTSVIRGFAETITTRVANSMGCRITIISKQSCRKAGTRYNSRGINDEGHVANFVESEIIVNIPETDLCASYTQVRGSVPLFWEQETQLLGTSSKVTITRSPQATQPAFTKHFQALADAFGDVHIVNLLSATKSNEIDLSRKYELQLKDFIKSTDRHIPFTHFDFHVITASSKGGYANASKILPSLNASINNFSFCAIDENTGDYTSEQTGVFRTNCLDCLDRTNFIQQVISKEILVSILYNYRITSSPSSSAGIYNMMESHNKLWANNGDQLSQIYTGTNALKTSFTRTGRMNLAGALSDMTKSVSRMYVNSFMDKDRQAMIDLLLGNNADQKKVRVYDPASEYVETELKKAEYKFKSFQNIKIWTGTFNVAGGYPRESLTSWIFPDETNDETDLPDLIFIGLQEIVELTAGNMMTVDPSKARAWENKLAETLKQKGGYVMIRTGSLGSLSLFIYAKSSKVAEIKNVETATKKTGMGGMTANKGALAISLLYGATSVVIVNCHMAAGQSGVQERIADYQVIETGIRFARNQTIKDHDVIVWVGDFNYRVQLPNDMARNLLIIDDLEALFAHDQLTKAKSERRIFRDYNEMKINFPPTYKFDKGTQTYDTSEKQRVPSWTDRILWKSSVDMKQLNYSNVDSIRFSDHRPVYSTFITKITIIDKELKKVLAQEFLKKFFEGSNTPDLLDLPITEIRTSHISEDITRHSTPVVQQNPPKPPPPRVPPPRSQTQTPQSRNTEHSPLINSSIDFPVLVPKSKFTDTSSENSLQMPTHSRQNSVSPGSSPTPPPVPKRREDIDTKLQTPLRESTPNLHPMSFKTAPLVPKKSINLTVPTAPIVPKKPANLTAIPKLANGSKSGSLSSSSLPLSKSPSPRPLSLTMTSPSLLEAYPTVPSKKSTLSSSKTHNGN